MPSLPLRRVIDWWKENRRKGVSAANHALLDIYLKDKHAEIRNLNSGVRSLLGEPTNKRVTLKMLQGLRESEKVDYGIVLAASAMVIERDIRHAIHAANRAAAGGKRSEWWKEILEKRLERARENDEIINGWFQGNKHFTITEIKAGFLEELRKRERNPLPEDEEINNRIHEAWLDATQGKRK